MRYKGGSPPLMIYTALRAAMICQACGLDKKILVPKKEDFLAEGISLLRNPSCGDPKNPSALRFLLEFFDRCAKISSLLLPQAALGDFARH